MNCKKCKNKCIKNGLQTNGKQRFYCKTCKISQQAVYTYNAYKTSTNYNIYKLLVNSCGISDISRVLNISRYTVVKRLLFISNLISTPVLREYNQSYEIDEIHAKVKGMGRNCYIAYAINRKTKQVVNFCIGNRTALQLSNVVNSVLLLNPKRIYTDKLGSYKKIIPSNIHKTGKIFTNKIERHHLNLRTHLKCLSRKTLCYSKSLKTIKAIIKIYFFGYTLNF